MVCAETSFIIALERREKGAIEKMREIERGLILFMSQPLPLPNYTTELISQGQGRSTEGLGRTAWSVCHTKP